jgi:hypothetical protein
MKIAIFFTSCLLASLLLSCNNEDKRAELSYKPEAPIQVANKLSGHVYCFAPTIDSTKCTVIPECDCCSDDFLFLNEKDFIRISYCMAEQTVIKGIYAFEKNNLILKYDSLVYYTENDQSNEIRTIGKGKKEYLIKKEIGKPSIDTLTQFSCKEKVVYKNPKEETFGTISEKDSIQIYIDELKKVGFWNKLIS